jgi:hypothetical protein
VYGRVRFSSSWDVILVSLANKQLLQIAMSEHSPNYCGWCDGSMVF